MSWSQGIYKVQNREKYLGTRDKSFSLTMQDPFYRSSWEQRLMYKFDTDPNILKWGYENIIIPYMNYDFKRKEMRQHRYLMDFYIEYIGKDSTIKKMLIEVKPRKDESAPIKPKIKNQKAMRRYMYEASTYIKNQNKWKSARQFCKSNNMEFKIMSEKDIFV